jgi:hypothetical protein
MSDLFTCPAPTALASIPATTCPVKFDQIQKLALRRITSRYALTPTNILLSATITPLLTAVDNTKLLITPFLTNVVIPPSEPIKSGGNDNTTLNGIPALTGLSFVGCSAEVHNLSSAAMAAFRALASESALQPGFTDLEGMLINKDGKVITDKASGASVYGFKIYNLCVSDVGSEGFAKNNIAKITWDMEGKWSENFQVYTPTDYNALTISN